MKVIVLIALFSPTILTSEVLPEEFKLAGLFFGCDRDVTLDYHKSLQEFSTRLFKKVAEDNGDHFVLSQYSIWLGMAAFAEGSIGDVQTKLFKALNLPKDSCLREKYYEIATSLETSAEDVTLSRRRVLVVDDNIKLNSTWAFAVRASGLIDTQKSSIKNNTGATNIFRDIINGTMKEVNLSPNANSVVLDSLDYKGLWTTAFDNASTESNADFFNDNGERIGKVELLKVKKRVKLAHIPLLNAKLMELPVGNNGRYRMLFIINHGKTSIRRTIEHFPSSLIVDIMPLLLESVIPLEIAIPRLAMTSELDLKKTLEGVGLDSIWKEGNAAKYRLVLDLSEVLHQDEWDEFARQGWALPPTWKPVLLYATWNENNSADDFVVDIVSYCELISEPQLHSSTVYQRVSVTIDRDGLMPQSSSPLPSLSNVATGLVAVVGRDFVANRPFIYGLVDSQTRTWLFSGVFSRPET